MYVIVFPAQNFVFILLTKEKKSFPFSVFYLIFQAFFYITCNQWFFFILKPGMRFIFYGFYLFIYLFLYVRLQIVSIQILLYLLNISCSKSGAFCNSCFHRTLLYGVYGSAVTWWWRWSKFTACLILTACDVNCFLCVQTCIYDGLFCWDWDFSFFYFFVWLILRFNLFSLRRENEFIFDHKMWN